MFTNSRKFFAKSSKYSEATKSFITEIFDTVEDIVKGMCSKLYKKSNNNTYVKLRYRNIIRVVIVGLYVKLRKPTDQVGSAILYRTFGNQ